MGSARAGPPAPLTAAGRGTPVPGARSRRPTPAGAAACGPPARAGNGVSARAPRDAGVHVARTLPSTSRSHRSLMVHPAPRMTKAPTAARRSVRSAGGRREGSQRVPNLRASAASGSAPAPAASPLLHRQGHSRSQVPDRLASAPPRRPPAPAPCTDRPIHTRQLEVRLDPLGRQAVNPCVVLVPVQHPVAVVGGRCGARGPANGSHCRYMVYSWWSRQDCTEMAGWEAAGAEHGMQP